MPQTVENRPFRDGKSVLANIANQALKAFIDIVRPNLPLELKHTRITAEDILYALAYANVHRLSIEAVCLELAGAPSGNRLREVLAESS